MSDTKVTVAQGEDLGEKMHTRLHSYNIECPQCGKTHKYSKEHVHEVATTPRIEGNPTFSVQDALNDETLRQRMHERLHSYNIECKECGEAHAPFSLDFSAIKQFFSFGSADSISEEECGDKMHERLHSYNIECPQCGKNHKYSQEKVHKVAVTCREEGKPTFTVEEALKDEALSQRMHDRLHSYNIECKECGNAYAPFTVDTSVVEHIFAGDTTPEEELGEKMHNRLHSYNIECKCKGKDDDCDCKK